ncbi:MAG: restriction endonuclease, partial [Thermorudis peleae]|nr:restriction endonuclease [Thermorudis peleae]
VIAHCLYAVDKNPLAVELCKVALWIEAHVPGQPLTFLDHRIKCGDSLVGVFDLAVLRDGIPDEAYERDDAAEKAKASSIKRRNRQERAGQLTLTADVVAFDKTLLDLGRLTDHVAQMPERTIAERRAKEQAYQQLQRDPRFRRLQAACDLWTAAFFADLRQSETVPTTDHVRQALAGTLHDARLTGAAQALASELRFFHWPLAFPDVFVRGGFDVVLGNPPFMGGLLISGILGPRYRKWLEAAFQPFVGMADLCAAFLRCAFSLLGRGGRMGIVATNTISQGDTRESGLVVILRQHGTITFARRFVRWPGTAKVEVNLVSIQKSDRTTFAADMAVLDGIAVPFISSRLDSDPEVEPKRLALNEGKAFQGDIVRGLGFVLTPKEAERLLTADPRNADCLFPYLNGEDVNSDAEQRPSRYVICFHDWDLERAKQYPALLRIVEERVKPERERLRGPGDQRNREYWWRFGAYRAGMRRAIAPLRRVLLRSRVSELHALVFVPTGWIYSEATIVFAFDDDYHFALLQSDVHEVWVRKQASSLRTDVRYTPTDCFDTFPFPLEEYKRLGSHEWRLEELPTTFQEAARVGAAYHEHRRQIMAARNLGLTKTYNLFHDPDCTDPDIARLRELHAAMDNAVLACYGWQDIDLHHDFYQNERGQTRFTVSPDARRELLRRLLELNLEVARWERSAGVQG